MKVGDSYFEIYVDAHEGRCVCDAWEITSIRGEIAHAIRKTDHTWVKVSKTSGDYGWARNISAYDRRMFKKDAELPAGWAKSKAAAYSKALPEVEVAIRRLTRIRAQLTGQRTKARSRSKNP